MKRTIARIDSHRHRFQALESTAMPSDFTAALDSLPHGPSFRFVDALTSLDPGRESAVRVAGKTLSSARVTLSGQPGV